MILTELSLRRPVTVAMFFVCMSVIGMIGGQRLPLEFLPDIEFPGIFVQIPYRNSTPEEEFQWQALRPAMLEVGRTRLRPIVMTTLTTVLGLLPMALSGAEGAEVRQPMAITVIGGLVVSTLLTLVVIPVVYSLVQRDHDTLADSAAETTP